MNFAKNLLGKYGWKEGDGLGRNKDGITKPLKANYKFDNAGFGHNIADDMNNSWWENVYNNASKNLIAETNELKEVTVASTSQNNEEPDKLKASEYAGSFLKGATLINQRQEVDCEHKAEISPVILRVVSDEELFKACGGRTAHKGGRHGLNLTGKLSRIEQQERELSSKIRSGKEKSSQVFKEYVERKSLSNKRKLKRLNEKKIKKVKKSVASTSTTIPTPTLQAPKVKNKKEKISEKSNRNKVLNGKIIKKKVKDRRSKLYEEMHVRDSRENFLKKMKILEVPISFESIKKVKKTKSTDLDDASLKSYRCIDEESDSDNEDEVQRNIRNQLSEKLKKIKKNKQKVVVENLTEFQLEHLRNAKVPYVEIKQSGGKKSKKSAEKFDNLANNLVDKLSIL